MWECAVDKGVDGRSRSGRYTWEWSVGRELDLGGEVGGRYGSGR
jgi:hypothetical protein